MNPFILFLLYYAVLLNFKLKISQYPIPMRCLCCCIHFLSIKICIWNENTVLSKPFLQIQNCSKVPSLLTTPSLYRIFYYNLEQHKIYSNLSSRQCFNIQRRLGEEEPCQSLPKTGTERKL